MEPEFLNATDGMSTSQPLSRSLQCTSPHFISSSIHEEEAAQRLAGLVEGGCSDDLRGHLIHLAVRVGARQLTDAAACLARIDEADAAGIASEQAMLIGSLQFPLVVGRDAEAAAILRKLAPTYPRLLSSLGGTSGKSSF
jgi:hypothetical protein